MHQMMRFGDFPLFLLGVASAYESNRQPRYATSLRFGTPECPPPPPRKGRGFFIATNTPPFVLGVIRQQSGS